jgi:hypothetical protein
MKKLSILIIPVMFMLSCKKEVRQISVPALSDMQSNPVCGVIGSQSNIPGEYRKGVETNIQGFTAPELLLFLDFDGAVVRRGFPNPTGSSSSIISFGIANCPSPLLSKVQIDSIVDFVADDFAPFKIRITTDQNEFLAYTPHVNKQLCIITTLPQVIGQPSNIGGVSPTLGFGNRDPFDPCFVFATLYHGVVPEIANTISHEVGHTLGLFHQSEYNEECGYVQEYNPGYGIGNISFGAIMGDPNGKRISNWYAQSCQLPEVGQSQDDFFLINSQVELRADDFPDGNVMGNVITSGPVDGILEKQNDVDFILINFRSPGNVVITSENIDIKASIITAGGHVLAQYNDPDDTGVTIPQVRGMMFLKIEAADNTNVSSRFQTGKYRVIF